MISNKYTQKPHDLRDNYLTKMAIYKSLNWIKSAKGEKKYRKDREQQQQAAA